MCGVLLTWEQTWVFYGPLIELLSFEPNNYANAFFIIIKCLPSIYFKKCYKKNLFKERNSKSNLIYDHYIYIYDNKSAFIYRDLYNTELHQIDTTHALGSGFEKKTEVGLSLEPKWEESIQMSTIHPKAFFPSPYFRKFLLKANLVTTHSSTNLTYAHPF